jgi:hypothetical protein
MLCALTICLPLLPKKVDIGVCIYVGNRGKVENMYENMQHYIVWTTRVGTLPFVLVVLKPCEHRKPICVPTEAKPGILIT